jgi:hypothetical protein
MLDEDERDQVLAAPVCLIFMTDVTNIAYDSEVHVLPGTVIYLHTQGLSIHVNHVSSTDTLVLHTLEHNGTNHIRCIVWQLQPGITSVVTLASVSLKNSYFYPKDGISTSVSSGFQNYS